MDEVADLYAAREEPAYKSIVRAIQVADDPSRQRIILAGTRGSGKTTELLRAFRDLSDDGGEFLPVYIDIAAAFSGPTGTLPILALVAAAVRHAADDWNAPKIPKNTDRLALALQTYGVTAPLFSALLTFAPAVATWATAGASVPVVSFASASFEAMNAVGAVATKALKGAVTDETRTEADTLVAAVRAEVERLREASGRAPVLLIDGIDKRATIAEVDEALHDADLLLSLRCAMVLSGPMQLRTDPRFAANVLPGDFSSVTLHNVPVVNTTTGERVESGVALLVDLYGKRVADDAGEPYRSLFSTVLLERAAHMSSGVIREFLTILKLAAQSASARVEGAGQDGPVTAEEMDKVIRKRRHALQSTLTQEDWDILQVIYERGELMGGEQGANLLFTNIVACYPNGDIRFRPNEMLIDYLEQRKLRE